MNEEIQTYLPEVNAASEFREISKDFTNPLEIIREAIHNSLDARATKISISAQMENTDEGEQLVISVFDNGVGMNEEEIKKFFSLGYSAKYQEQEEETIGYKGHGTKIYYNSNKIEVTTIALNGPIIKAWVDKPLIILNQRKVPIVNYTISKNSINIKTHSTNIKIIGYNNNNNDHFTTQEMIDYILWFTKLGSFELALYPERKNRRWAKCEVLVRGVDSKDYKTIHPGHVFPPERFKDSHFKKDNIKENNRGKYFTKYWMFKNITIPEKRHITMDIFISVEGDQAKRDYNPCLKSGRREGLYTVSERYGIWLAKDYIPVQRVNDWFFQKSEWTKFHGFINCQGLELTANRGSIENTPNDLLIKIKDIAEKIIDEIRSSNEYEDFLDMENEVKIYKKAEDELKDFSRRQNYLKKKKTIITDDGIELIEPRQEQGVFALFLILSIKYPDIFPFKVIDYDTRQGYDALVATKSSLDLARPHYQFIEFKYKLGNRLNHSFDRLAGIVCWDLDDNLFPDSEIVDLTGNRRILKASKTAEGNIFMLDSEISQIKIRIYILKHLIEEKLRLKWEPRLVR
ncbi:ATP-binding protein [Zhaonella formicivorans]|uniref:ATP-binding protein n=1 Tax=Zhaonella formicivorans TaxID=2528593 RepID=UPI0010D88452|nr:ATP-binding protein [Zhaonella formicivorans]